MEGKTADGHRTVESGSVGLGETLSKSIAKRYNMQLDQDGIKNKRIF